MHINQVRTAKKFGNFVLKQNHRNKIDINYLPDIPRQVLYNEIPRIYLFVVDGIIKKIGGSSGKGGIKATMNFYVSSMTGSPGVPRFILHLLIAEALKKGSEVELYVIASPKVLATINGLFGSKQVEIASFKEMEDFCKSDYYSVEHKYPDWNFQENHQPYPKRLARLHVLYHQKRLKRKKR
jgi:hypothetical protein